MAAPRRAGGAALFRPAAGVAPVAAFDAPEAVNLQVPDKPLVVRLTPR